MNNKIDEIYIEITNRCNFNCAFCPNSIMKRPRGLMTEKMFRSVIDQLAKTKLAKRITFHLMGEPLLHPKFAEFLAYAKKKKQYIHLISNISLIKGDKLKDIMKNVSLLELSLQSYSAESFSQRGTRLDYGQYLQTVRDIIEAKFANRSDTIIKISVIENSLNIIKNFRKDIDVINSSARLEQFLEKYWYKFFESLAKKYALKFQKPKNYKLNGFIQEFLPGVFLATRWATTWGNNLADKNKVIPAWRAKCDGLWQQLGILWDGRVVPCCGDYDGQVVLGDLTKRSLLEIVKSEKYQKIKAGFRQGVLLHPYCKKCKGGTTFLSWLASQLYSFYKFRNIR